MAEKEQRGEKRKREVTVEDINDIVRIIKSNNRKKARKYDFTNDEIQSIARIMKRRRGLPLNIPNSVFSVEFLRNNIHFQHDEAIYQIDVNKDNMQTLPDFLNSVKQVFQYFINVAKFMSNSGNDKVRFYISKAPRTPFSTAILNVNDLNVEFFYNIFERHRGVKSWLVEYRKRFCVSCRICF